MSSCILKITVVVLLVAALVSGCGGGGGDEGKVNAISPVTVSAPSSMPVIGGTKLVDDYYDNIEFSGVISGNLDSLNGKKVLVLVEDPANLFQNDGYLIIQPLASGATYKLSLIGKQLKVAGHFTGNVRVRACLDASCTLPIAGTPLLLPYNVKVEAGLTVSRNEINVTVPFGMVPAPEVVDIGYSSFGKGWGASISSPDNKGEMVEHRLSIGNTTYGYSYPTISVLPATGVTLTDKQMQILIHPPKPGNYFHIVKVSAVATLPNLRQLRYEQTVNVRYNVTPNPAINSLFYPAALDFTQKQQTTFMYYDYQLITNTGIASQFVGIEYLTAAGTTGPFNSWWKEYPYKSAFTCYSSISPDCLTPGVYTAQVRYRLITSKGTLGDVLFPIRMTVTGA